MTKNLIQIAGIKDQQEAELMLNCGVDRLGFPLRIASRQEDLSENEAARMIQALQLQDKAVLITYVNDAQSLATFSRRLDISIVQLHGNISLPELRQIKSEAPRLYVIKSLIVRGDNLASLTSDMTTFAPYIDEFIVDTFDPSTGACGATGKTHDWDMSRALVEMSPRPVILAGGLTARNVRRAIERVRPRGVDAHTGVEDSSGRKRRSLLEAFVSRAREGFAAI
ncbi:MAG: phosphoribosylanthranilate isomerase [Candidatus Latescibacterota bacterium]